MPVLPAVPSTIKPPRSMTPRRSPSSTMYFAARSFTDPPGFKNSALPRCCDLRPVAGAVAPPRWLHVAHRAGELSEEVVDGRRPERLLRFEVVVDLRLVRADALGDGTRRG